MYPRNAASPPRIGVGQVIQISDGAIQSSGVSVVVRPQGGAESAGGGTIEYSAATNLVYYTPTQAETNHESFVVIAYKSGCLAADKTIVTTASAVAGKADVGSWNGTALSTTNPLPNAAPGSNNGLPTVDANNRIAGIQGTITTLDALDTAQDTQHQSTVNLIGSGGANLNAVPWNAAWDAEVQSEVQDAIEVNHLDHLLAAAYDPASKPGAADALLNELVESDAGVSRFTANALEQAPSGGLDAAGVRAAIGLASANLDTQLADLPTVAEFEARTLAAASYFDPSTDVVSANLTQILGDALAETSAGYLSAAFEHFFDVSTPSKTINDVGVAGSGITAQEVRDAMKLAPSAGAAAEESIDYYLGLIDEKTGLIPADGFPTNFHLLDIAVSGYVVAASVQGNVTGSVGSVSGSVGSVAGNVGGNVVGSVGSVVGAINTGSGAITTLDGLNSAQTTEHDATQAAVAAVAAVTNKLDTGLEDDGSSGWQWTSLAVENAPAGGGGGGDATAANQTTIIGHLTDIKGASFSGSTDSLEAIRDRGDAAWVGGTVVIDEEDIDSIVAGVIAGIGTGDVVASSQSVTNATDVSVIQGDDYLNADGRAIVWIATSADFWPSLAGATLAFTATMGGVTIEAVPVVVSATGTQSVRLELTSDDTSVASGEYAYDVQATLASGSVVTLVRGKLYVERDVTP